MRLKILSIIFLQFALFNIASAQPGGSIHGNFQIDAQYYVKDSIIGAEEVPERLLSNGFANFIYTNKNFSAGIRYENYTNPMLGFDEKYAGNGFPYKYVSYQHNELEVTAGSFYEQFGSGLVFRTYEERGLGYDNAMEGLRVKYTPLTGFSVKGIIGYQRDFWNKGEGIVRGIDADWEVNESLGNSEGKKTRYILGGSFVSKYQDDQNPIYNLPENVGAGGGRLTVIHGNLNLYGEFIFKANDPSISNGMIYKPGSASYVTATYSDRGIGLTLAAKRIDNMNFRSDRNATSNSLMINFLPAMTKTHTYLLPALYPYATQPNGEYGFQGEFFYNAKTGSLLGGSTGADISINYARAQAIDKQPTGDELGYTSDFFKTGPEVYYEDFNVEYHRKWNKKIHSIISYYYINYNEDVIEGTSGHGNVYSHTGIIETSFRFSSRHNLRTEIQNMYTKQDEQSWAAVLAEYSISPHWFFAAFDQYNYGNDIKSKRLHYYTGSISYVRGANRMQLSYGRQRAGILCVGGVCRQVPASNGFTISITSSF